MRTLPAFSTLLLLALALGGLGCSSTNDGGLSVMGSVTITQGATSTGYNFHDGARLDDDRVAPADGHIAGHCTIVRAHDAEPQKLSFGVVTNAAVSGIGVQSYTIRVDRDMGTSASGAITARLGGRDYSGSTASPGCTITVKYATTEGPIAGVTSTCNLVSGGGETATAVADLDFENCTVE